jgi:hypothetical protein
MRSTGVYRATRRKPTAHRPHGHGNFLAPALTVAAVTGAGVTSVRKHCAPVACDTTTRALLYDAQAAVAAIQSKLYGDTTPQKLSGHGA